MPKIIIVGTLHGGITPNNELKEVLEELNPDQLLVEMKNKGLIDNKTEEYPSEMIFVYNWAKENNIKVFGFDSDIDTFREGVTQEDNQAIIEKQDRAMGNLSWKDFNIEENNKLLDVEGIENLINPEKEKMREMEMLKNIQNNIIKNGTVVIITGAGHLNFFEKNIKDAVFPFRGKYNA
jgi:hypothetical protein